MMHIENLSNIGMLVTYVKDDYMETIICKMCGKWKDKNGKCLNWLSNMGNSAKGKVLINE